MGWQRRGILLPLPRVSTRKRHAADLVACYLPRHSRVHPDNLGRQKGQRQMCEICSQRTMGRRRFLALAGFGLAAGGALFGIDHVAAAHGPTTSVTANQALANLKSGNAKYVKSPQVCAADLAKRRTAVTTSQTPWATILGCADSRVPPELLFGGLGVGELFVAAMPATSPTPRPWARSNTAPPCSACR